MSCCGPFGHIRERIPTPLRSATQRRPFWLTPRQNGMISPRWRPMASRMVRVPSRTCSPQHRHRSTVPPRRTTAAVAGRVGWYRQNRGGLGSSGGEGGAGGGGGSPSNVSQRGGTNGGGGAALAPENQAASGLGATGLAISARTSPWQGRGAHQHPRRFPRSSARHSARRTGSFMMSALNRAITSSRVHQALMWCGLPHLVVRSINTSY